MTRHGRRRNAVEACGGESPLPPLPYDLASDVLSRLAAKTLLSLRCVCKSWCSLIDDDLFISRHLARSKCNPLFVFDMYYGNFLCFREFGNPMVEELSIPDEVRTIPTHTLLASYNGLLFFGRDTLDTIENPLIVNPVTRETVVLPRTNCYERVATQLFFNPKSKEHKVLIISLPPTTMYERANQVFTTLVSRIFTVGKALWRKTTHHGEFRVFQRDSPDAPLVRGFIHWINGRTSFGNGAKILGFDVEEELFRTFAGPPCCNFCSDGDNCIQDKFLLEYRGSLCLIHKVSTWDMWVMRDGEMWVKEKSIFTNYIFSGVSGSAFTKCNGEILMMIRSLHAPTVWSYHPELATLQVFRPPIQSYRRNYFYVESLVKFNRKC